MSGRAAPLEGTEVAFYIGDGLVTTNLDKNIQIALYGDGMIKYLQSKYEWTQNNSINLKAVGLAKARLPHAALIRVSKMMHEWLNVGFQKERINGSATGAL